VVNVTIEAIVRCDGEENVLTDDQRRTGMSEATQPDSGDLEWLTLDEDETLVWSGKPHKSSLIPALIIGVPLSVVLIGLVIIGAAYLYRENTRYVVTTDALYRKSGVVSRDVQRIDFGKVQNTSYSQGFFGARFGYGNVDISTAGGSGVEMQFQSVPEPRHIQETINKRVKAQRGNSTREDGETKSDVLADILDELRAIRETIDAQQPQPSTEGDTAETSVDTTVTSDAGQSNSTDE
jgi:membrane protein YdbS with pleckstrin-like domain